MLLGHEHCRARKVDELRLVLEQPLTGRASRLAAVAAHYGTDIAIVSGVRSRQSQGGDLFTNWHSHLRDGRDLSGPINRLLDRVMGLFSPGKSAQNKKQSRKKQPAFKVSFGGGKGSGASDTEDLGFQERLDAILDKIKENGYENLSQEEKDFLYNASKR